MNNRKSKVKSKIILLIIIATLIAIISGTYSRYTSTGTLNGKATMAKWSIKLKGDEAEASNISSASATVETTAQTVEGVSNANVSAGKIAPGQTLVATVEVDPSGSEVAIDYNLELNSISTEGFNSTSNIAISRVTGTVDGGTETNAALLGGKYVFFESLEDVLANKKVTFKTYINWANGDNVADTENGMSVDEIVVPIGITAKQHLASDGMLISVDADNSLEEIASSISEGNMIVLKKDLDYSNLTANSYNTIQFPDDTVLNLDGKTITSVNGAKLYSGNNLKIENGRFVGLADQWGRTYGLQVWNMQEKMGNVEISDVVVEGGVNFYNLENVVLKNVTTNATNFYAVYGNMYTTITIESGEYTCGDNAKALIGYKAKDTDGGVEVTNPSNGLIITGGTFITNGKPLFHQAADHQNGIIYGGTFDCDVTAYLAPGKTCTPNGSGMWVVE